MKKTKLLSLLLFLFVLTMLLFSFVSCGKEEAETPKTIGEGVTTVTKEESLDEEIPAEGLWKDATYRAPVVLGEGKTEFKLKVEAEDKSLTFTIKTDEENLGKALLNAKIVEGEDGAYGLYIKKVNGMLADYDVNQTYWSFCIDGEAQMTGVSDVSISGGEEFELVLSK